jgi:hypothetical protein
LWVVCSVIFGALIFVEPGDKINALDGVLFRLTVEFLDLGVPIFQLDIGVIEDGKFAKSFCTENHRPTV